MTINPIDGDKNTARSVAWRFGPDWPGRRCGAKTRRGTPCQKPALRGKNRCQLHGGRAGGPSGSRNGRYRHGRYTKANVAAEKEAMQRVKELERLGRLAGLWEEPNR